MHYSPLGGSMWWGEEAASPSSMLVGVTRQKPTGTTVGVEPMPSLCSQQLHCRSGMLDHQLVTNKARRSRNLAIYWDGTWNFWRAVGGVWTWKIEQIFQDLVVIHTHACTTHTHELARKCKIQWIDHILNSLRAPQPSRFISQETIIIII
jgi:hypothetical protein